MVACNGHPGILDRLAAGELLIFDGATGTYLQEHGLEAGGSPELMNAAGPDAVREMARHYFEAGSDIVLTNSFGGNRFILAKYGVADRLFELNRLAAEHARSAAPRVNTSQAQSVRRVSFLSRRATLLKTSCMTHSPRCRKRLKQVVPMP